MIDPKKKLRSTLYNIHKVSYRIKIKSLDKETMDKKAFIEVIRTLRKIEERRDFMQSEIGLDMTTYEDEFFYVIENLLKMTFNKQQLSLIQMYLFQLLPDKDWDGTITLNHDNKEKIVMFKSPTDIWKVVKLFEE